MLRRGTYWLAVSVALWWGCSSTSPSDKNTDTGTAIATEGTSAETGVATGASDSGSDTADTQGTGSDTVATCAEDNPCVNGTCVDSSTGPTCVCNAGWGGDACDQCAAGWHLENGECVVDQKCQPSSCSGREVSGGCDDSSGTVVCVCANNWNPATNCATCIDGYHAKGDVCVPDETCDTDACSGHGTCDDSTKEAVCTCDPGWAGADCSVCAPGYHQEGDACVMDQQCLPNSCSYHGTCDASTGVVTCSCEPGYGGDYCEQCDTGYHLADGVCVADETCDTDSCNGHGTCDDSTGEAVCTCAAGWTGATCAACAPGFHLEGDACVLDQVCLSSTCSGHGTCSASGGVVSCACDPGYAGTYCDTCDTGYHWKDGVCVADETCDVDSCSGHGSCDDSTGEVVCTCAAGWTGAACNVCAPGFHLDNGSCVLDQQCMPTSCSGHGTCDDTGGVITCTCESGYTPASYCSSCATGFHESGGACVLDEACTDTSCSGHGQCDDSTKEVVCTCDPGWTGDTCNTCASGYHLEGGDCVLDQQCLDNSCSYHGTCDDTGGVIACSCETGYRGTYCEQCDTGYHLEGGACVVNEVCSTNPDSCNGHGTCDDTTGVVVCSCDTGWAGTYCTVCAPGYHNDGGACVLDETCLGTSCNNHGTCSDSTGVVVCSCETGWDPSTYCASCATGYHDEAGVCVPNEVCAGDSCNGHGQCDDSTGVITCACDAGYTGTYCDACDAGYTACGTSCCGSGQVCYNGACCTPTACDALSTFVECGDSGIDDGCGGTVQCGDCGANGTCQTDNTCQCDANYGVLSGGHECVHACAGYLPAEGCCDGSWVVYCDQGSMQTADCSLLSPPYNDCGWLSAGPYFTCNTGETPPPDVSATCPSNIVVDKTPQTCDDDTYEENDDWTSNPTDISGMLPNPDIYATKCIGDDDFYALNLSEGQTITITLDYTAANLNMDLVLWYQTVDMGSWSYADASFNSGDQENINYTVPAGSGGLYLVHVVDFGEGSQGTGYHMTISVTP